MEPRAHRKMASEGYRTGVEYKCTPRANLPLGRPFPLRLRPEGTNLLTCVVRSTNESCRRQQSIDSIAIRSMSGDTDEGFHLEDRGFADAAFEYRIRHKSRLG